MEVCLPSTHKELSFAIIISINSWDVPQCDELPHMQKGPVQSIVVFKKKFVS